MILILSEDKSPYKIGVSAQLSKIVKDEDIRIFAEITGDKNPLHLDDEFASKTIFQRRIAHGTFTAGLISAVIGSMLPGSGTIYHKLSIFLPLFTLEILSPQKLKYWKFLKEEKG